MVNSTISIVVFFAQVWRVYSRNSLCWPVLEADSPSSHQNCRNGHARHRVWCPICSAIHQSMCVRFRLKWKMGTLGWAYQSLLKRGATFLPLYLLHSNSNTSEWTKPVLVLLLLWIFFVRRRSFDNLCKRLDYERLVDILNKYSVYELTIVSKNQCINIAPTRKIKIDCLKEWRAELLKWPSWQTQMSHLVLDFAVVGNIFKPRCCFQSDSI